MEMLDFCHTELLDLARPGWSVLLGKFALTREDKALAMSTCTELPCK